jgi:hypothetical protein
VPRDVTWNPAPLAPPAPNPGLAPPTAPA